MVLSVVAQCFAIASLSTLMWVIFGYSLTFSNGGNLQLFIGGLHAIFLKMIQASQPGLVADKIALVAIGAGILWIGWFGFNAGGAVHTGRISLVVLNTQIAAASGALSWMLSEWITKGKPSALGLLFGAIQG